MIVSQELNLLINRFNENKLAHAFLLETNNVDKCYKDILGVIKYINCPNKYLDDCHDSECNLCSLIESGNLPSLCVIDSDTMSIKKDSIEELLDKFSTKPIYSKYNVYVFMNAEKLNGKSANMLLKFIEEPSDDIIGFFITNNAENVLLTIKSRCQVMYCKYGNIDEYYDDEMLDQVKIYLSNVLSDDDSIIYNREVIKWYKERAEYEDFFKKMLYYINDCYLNKRKDKIDAINKLSNNSMIKIIILIKKVLEYLESNVNIDLILDMFVIEMRECYE